MTYEEFEELNSKNLKDGFIWLREENMDIGGGKISIRDIDKIKEFTNLDKVAISGLKQDTFEYFIKNYGKNIKYLKFFKDKMIEDLSLLSELNEIIYIEFFHNQRVTKLWNMEKNYKLEGLYLNDFTRLHSLDGIQTAPNLKYLHFGNAIWNTSGLDNLKPLINTNLISFCFGGNKINDNDISIYYTMKNLRYLDFRTNLYTTEEIAKIIAKCPNISGYALKPYIKFDRNNNDYKDVLICGKRKPFLYYDKDITRIKKYCSEFNNLVEKYKDEN